MFHSQSMEEKALVALDSQDFLHSCVSVCLFIISLFLYIIVFYYACESILFAHAQLQLLYLCMCIKLCELCTHEQSITINTLFYFLGQIRMNAALIMENVHRTVTIHMEATTVLVIVDMYSLLIKKIVMVRIIYIYIYIYIYI